MDRDTAVVVVEIDAVVAVVDMDTVTLYVSFLLLCAILSLLDVPAYDFCLTKIHTGAQ